MKMKVILLCIRQKGSDIENVLVVLDEFFWSKYNFSNLFLNEESTTPKYINSLKLFYVACSRAVKNLIIVKLFSNNDDLDLVSAFENSEEVKLN